MKERYLERTDKNGTEYWVVTESCLKCGGSGYIHCYGHIQGGICFECGGSGTNTYTEKKMLPEYEAKLIARRAARAEKKKQEMMAKADEANQEFLQKQGFDTLGRTYVVLGNTYAIKDELKEKGAKWCNLIGWHLPVALPEYETVEILVDDVYFKDGYGMYRWNNWKSYEEETYSAKIKAAKDKHYAKDSTSEYQFEVGQKVEVELNVLKINWFDSIYGTHYIYNMQDANGNVFIWKTACNEIQEGDKVTIKATVKEHNEYRGVKQTVLTRCKVV